MKAFLKKHTPEAIWKAMVSGKDFVLDSADEILQQKDDLIPPRRLIFTGGGAHDFLAIGNEFLDYFRRLGGLEPQHQVLELGCGMGRMAVPLTKYLSENGSYKGLDIVPLGIKWCTDKITARHPNFHFQLADIRNSQYNPNGHLQASEFRFPYSDDSFDFIFATSVFTHMLPREVNNYLSEIHRVLKPGKKCLITWFLLNEESSQLINSGVSSHDLRYTTEGCFTTGPKEIAEAAVGYHETQALDYYKKNGFVKNYPVHYGSWCGRNQYVSYQDICIATKCQ